eukprot:5653381-Alexandrium_andersonii.AAC.1
MTSLGLAAGRYISLGLLKPMRACCMLASAEPCAACSGHDATTARFSKVGRMAVLKAVIFPGDALRCMTAASGV